MAAAEQPSGPPPQRAAYRIVRASAEHAIDAVSIIDEYQDAIGVIVRDSPEQITQMLSSSTQGSADEGSAAAKAVWLAYPAPGGVAKPVGCIALRKLSSTGGELKRLYVQPAHRGSGVAQQLLSVAEAHAIATGCRFLYLDTKDDLDAAVRFYHGAGYTRCDRYNDNPQATIFMRKELIELGTISIRPFDSSRPGDAEAFRLLNEAWITTLFTLEPKDRETLGDPEGKILAKGGQIFMAERDGGCIGCCAVLAMGNHTFELAKMAVSEQARGQGLGRHILTWTVAEMRRQGAKRLYLETNSRLKNAIHLYRSAGFRQLDPHERTPSPYARADVAMELLLEQE